MISFFHHDSISKTSRKQVVINAGLLFLLLILIETALMFMVSGDVPNHVTSPFIGYLPTFANTWSDNWNSNLQILWSHAFMVVSHHDRYSDLDRWAIFYYPVTLLVYLLASSLAGYCLVYEKCWKRNVQTYIALFLLIMSVTYISMLQYSAGPTWVFQIPFLAKNSIVYNPKIYWYMLTNDSKDWIGAVQWLLATLGLVWLIGLAIRKDKKTF